MGNSFSQITEIKKVMDLETEETSCLIKIEFLFQEKSTCRYFTSEISGATSYLWDKIIGVLLN